MTSVLLIKFGAVLLASLNSWQPLQPGPSNYAARTGFSLGYPAGGTYEPDVLEQFDFSEGSGAIVGEVTSLSLAAQGTPVYSVTKAEPWKPVAPCITMDTSDYFTANPGSNELDLGTNDATIEINADLNFDTGINYVFAFWADATARGYSFSINAGGATDADDVVTLHLRATDGSSAIISWTLNGDQVEGQGMMKHLVRADRSGNATYFINRDEETSVSPSADISALELLSITAPTATIGAYQAAGANEWNGEICEIRISTNLTNNSGLPPGV
jgi:hypothetical protein